MKIRARLLALLFTFFSSFTHANSLDQGIEHLLSQAPQPIHVGIIVRDTRSGKILYSRYPDYLFAPASVQKLLTATAALSFLGPNFTYKTKLFIKGRVENNVLNGDLLIQFSGDPELNLADLRGPIGSLKERHITAIHGHVYIDTSLYDHHYYPPGWLWDDLSYSYAAPLSTVVINKNKFLLCLTPAEKLGQKPSYSVSIPNSIVKFHINAITTAHFNKQCPLTIYSHASNEYTVQGCLNKDLGKQSRGLALRDPIPLGKATILQALHYENISYAGEVKLIDNTDGYRLFSEHQSAPLTKLLKHMLKKSDNLITDSLLKQLGVQYYKEQGSWKNGLTALKKVLADSHIDFNKNLIDDGAGLSRYNLLSPNQLSLLLQYVYQNPAMQSVMMDSLPIGGIDGTLIGRMFSEAKDKRVHAKTGSMTGVAALAGYIETRHLGVVSFAIIINGFLGKHKPFNRLEDHIVEYFAHYPDAPTHE